MADGTLRISFDIEPRHAQDAFKLFASPGTPAAIAALTVGYAAAKDTQIVRTPDMPVTENPVSEKPKIGPLAYWAVLRCKESEFQKWLAVSTEADARDVILSVCEIDSRKLLDTDYTAGSRFREQILGPYSKHLAARGIVA